MVKLVQRLGLAMISKPLDPSCKGKSVLGKSISRATGSLISQENQQSRDKCIQDTSQRH